MKRTIIDPSQFELNDNVVAIKRVSKTVKAECLEKKVSENECSEDEEIVVDGEGAYAIPGLIDLHFHGCVGADVCETAPVRPDGVFFATGSSTSVFHSLQAGHCPSHLLDSKPHSLQKNTVVFAFAIYVYPSRQRMLSVLPP